MNLEAFDVVQYMPQVLVAHSLTSGYGPLPITPSRAANYLILDTFVSSDPGNDNLPIASATAVVSDPTGRSLLYMVGMRTLSSPTLATFLTSTSPSRLKLFADPLWRGRCQRSLVSVASQSQSPSPYGKPPFRFETGIGLFAKRSPRPFPPPFLSPPSVSFSDPLSTHHQSRDRRARAFVNGELIKGLTNGDDAVYASDYFICANDGVGAWAARPRGHAG